MALISFFSAKGAPGVTSTAMLVAALWPRPTLLVDADGNGGDLLMRLPSESGLPLTQHPGLLTLLPLARHGLSSGVVLDHSQVALGGQQVLVGLETSEQAEASAALWPTLARAFREVPGTDVVVDAGQLAARSGQLSLVQRSDLVVGVVRAEPASVMHMRERLTVLTQTFAALGADAPRVGLVALSGVQRQDEASSAITTVRADFPDVLDLGQVALDPRPERMFHGDPVSRPERTMLVRSGRSLVERLVAALGPAVVLDTGAAGHADADTDAATGDQPPAPATGQQERADGIPEREPEGQAADADAGDQDAGRGERRRRRERPRKTRWSLR
ncbi:hypothetical protein AVL62_14870 [Serinicoccus chungangensis]|uniref:CobQ/CobB/MinD/ParA nucleotide binding domain-containing protein n=1 Tax=Serinicoccus chungangensis TaxID=767452 RepID=A0A0W8I486_9MICO|nr:hypothetical protein [Serinicoccus chungangensis]KUG52849.1 hypothetical protein AVL62_14870 [Serinicoccus chungangensis]